MTTAPVTVNRSLYTQQPEQRSADQCFLKCGSPPALWDDFDTHVAVEIRWGKGAACEMAPCCFWIPPAFPQQQEIYMPLAIAKDANEQPLHAPGEVSECRKCARYRWKLISQCQIR